jgi:death-on-curing protein
MKCPDKAQILQLHEQIVISSGGSMGLRDEGAFDSALAQPFVSFGGQRLTTTSYANVFIGSMITPQE